MTHAGKASNETLTLSYLYDGNGNIISTCNQHGEIIAKLAYSPFGKKLSGADLSFTFSSKTVDASGLVYYGLRFYNPEMGRWMSRDPIGEKGGCNLYLFVRNNQMNYFDHIGLQCRDCSLEYETNMNMVDALLQGCREAVVDESKTLYNSLWDSAENTWKLATEKADESLKNMLDVCNKIDRSTLQGTIEYGVCKTAAYTAHHTAITAAGIAMFLAIVAIGGEITAFELGRYANCSLENQTNVFLVNQLQQSCWASYGYDKQGCPCKSFSDPIIILFE